MKKGGVAAVGKVVRELSGGPLAAAAAASSGTFKQAAKNVKLTEQRKGHADKWNFGSSVFGGRFISP